MAYIPSDTRWYLADIVLELLIEGDSRNVVHTNLRLIEAASPEQAYEKALALGRNEEQTYTNTDGNQVRVVFRGLADLNAIHDALEDGAELAFSESVSVPPAKLRARVRRKEQLGVFAPHGPRRQGPNYMPDSIMRKLRQEGFSLEEPEGQA
jgi:hypothetical protein